MTSSSDASSTGIGGGCAGTSVKAEPVPLDIFVMLDQSGSMSMDAGNNLSRWQTVRTALQTFVLDPKSDGIGFGIQYFGQPTPLIPGCNQMACLDDLDCTGGCGPCLPQGICGGPFNPDEDSCAAVDYAWADVPIAELPGVGNDILVSMGMHAPGTNTPTSPALEGAIMYAKAWAMAHPTHITVVAFATDGEPAICGTDMAAINAIAAAGFDDAPSIKTYVVGVGPALNALDGIAAAGGTTEAFHVDLDPMATEQFTQAMNTIRGASLACNFMVPEPPDGMTADYDAVNVAYTPGDGSAQQVFPRVDDQAHCPVTGDGWYYDDPLAPTQILFCQPTCDKVAGDIMAEIDIVLGCATIIT